MTETADPPRWAECPQCGERLGVRPESAGKKGRCAKCGTVFVIAVQEAAAPTPAKTPPKAAPKSPASAARSSPPAAADLSSPPAARPVSITFSCELCGTRITVRSTDVGKKVRCPDCNRKNVIPAPEAPAAPRIPDAMLGEQYELWGVDEVPPPAPKKGATQTQQLHPVECTLCRTLMYARDDQIGKKLKCPDCGSFTVARERAPQQPAGPVLVPAGKEYQVDRHSGIVKPFAARPLTPEEEAMQSVSQISSVTRAMAEHKNRVIEPPKQRPKRPRNPLLTGALRMIFTEELIARWIALSLGLGVVGQILSETLLSNVGQGFAAAGISIIMMIETIFAVIFGALWFGSFGPLIVVIVGESAEGNDRLEQAPKLLAFDWFAEAASAAFAFVLGGLAGMGAWKVAALAPGATVEVRAIAAVATFFALFPFAMLSTLLEGTPIAVISPKLLTTFITWAGPWLLFYVETFALAAIVGGILWWAAPASSGESTVTVVWIGAAALVGALLIDMRLLGRLAWWISDSMPEKEERNV